MKRKKNRSQHQQPTSTRTNPRVDLAAYAEDTSRVSSSLEKRRLESLSVIRKRVLQNSPRKFQTYAESKPSRRRYLLGIGLALDSDMPHRHLSGTNLKPDLLRRHNRSVLKHLGALHVKVR